MLFLRRDETEENQEGEQAEPEEEFDPLFELRVESGKVLLRISPAVDGVKADLDDIQEELHTLDVDYLPETLLEIYENETNEFEVLCDEENVEYQFIVEMARGAESAYLTVIPPTGETWELLTPDRLESELQEVGIVMGIMKDVLQKIVDEEVFNDPVLVARGRKPVHGKDGYVQLVYGSEDHQKRETALRINHREMQILSTAKMGDVLINIIPPTSGKNGFNVKGAAISAKHGKKCVVMPGRNTAFNVDRTQVFATKSGFVVFQGNKISIENIYRVKNVDSTVGNLNFDGIIYVDGNVEDAYTVRASVRIQVKGSVGKAVLHTNGDVRVGQGVLGAQIRAGRSVECSFISDALVEAGRSVKVKEYVINSKVYAGQVIQITNEDGFFHGGVCHAGNFINIPNVGSGKIGDETMVEVGVDPETRRHFNELESDLTQNLYNFNKIKKNLLILQSAREKRLGVLPQDHENLFESMTSNVQKLRDALTKDVKEWRDIVDIIKTEHERSGGIIFIEGNTYIGTVIKIRRQLHHIKIPVANVAFSSHKGKIQVQGYEDVIKRFRRFFL